MIQLRTIVFFYNDYNNTMCILCYVIIVVRFGNPCTDDNVCKTHTDDGVCTNNICSCKSGYDVLHRQVQSKSTCVQSKYSQIYFIYIYILLYLVGGVL